MCVRACVRACVYRALIVELTAALLLAGWPEFSLTIVAVVKLDLRGSHWVEMVR